MLSHCSSEQLGVNSFFLFPTKEQPLAEEDDCGYAREIRWKELWLQCSSSFRFSCRLSSVKGRCAREVSLLYG